MRRFIVILGCYVGLLSCNSEQPVEVSNFSEQQLVVEGYFTDDVKKQEFNVSLVNNIGDSTLVSVDNFNLKMSTISQQFPFILENGTQSISESAFGGVEYGIYELQFCYEGICYKKDIEMPVKSVINSFEITANNFDSLSTGALERIDVNISVAKSQYLRYELFWMDILAGDTNWILMPQPIYWTTEVLQGSYDYQLNERHVEHHNVADRAGLMIKVYSLSKATGEYFEQLESFVQAEFTGSQYQNPPYFYPGRVHGIVYGTVIDSATYFF